MPDRVLHLWIGDITKGMLDTATNLVSLSPLAPGEGEATPNTTTMVHPLTGAVAGVVEVVVGVIRVAVGVSTGPGGLHLLTNPLEVSSLTQPRLQRLGTSFSLQKLFLCSLLLV